MTTPRSLVLTLALAGCATADQHQQMEARVAQLEQKVEALEKAPKAAGTAAADPAAEAAAKKLYESISEKVSKGEMEAAKAEMSELTTKYAATTMAKRARKMSAELEVVGKAVPSDWSKSVEKYYQGEGNVDLSTGTTLVVFWEVWCPHCRREVPELKATYESLNGKGLNVVGLTKITRSATEEKVVDFIKENDVTYPTAKEDGKLSKEFNVSGIPAAAVVKDGKIIWRGHPARLNDELLTGWL
ncbi:MAG: TlpA disulfide reductase family protein [Myxococcota bacterium]|nr:TlpA disulfide reductase family protein [Myxococcota bacterium]